MKRFFSLLLALALSTAQVDASSLALTQAGGVNSNSLNYTGPGDILSGAFGWWGLRCYAKANAGANALTIRRASDNTTQTITLLASTCALDTATASTFCNATTCFATTLFDQSGNGNNLAQATNGSQPQLIFNCINTSLPCLRGANAQVMSVSRSGGTVNQPVTAVIISKRTSATSSYNQMVSFFNGTNSLYCAYKNSSGNMELGGDDGSMTVADVEGAWHVFQCVWNTPSSFMQIDATTSSSANPTVRSAYATTNIMANGAGTGQFLNGDWTEMGLWGQAIGSTNRNSLCNNAFTYWATSTSC